MRVLDLFSGIGGFSVGLERCGMQTVAFCEIDPFRRAELRRHWTDVPIYEDVRTLSGTRLRADGIDVELVCGGFPCQDISVAGNGAGLSGERSGLWREFARIVSEVRPRYVVVENVSALTVRGLLAILGDLAALRFDAQWHAISASAVGAPHVRDRVWIIGYTDADSRRCEGERLAQYTEELSASRNELDGLGPWRWWSRPIGTESGSERFATGRGLLERLARSLAAASACHPWLIEPDVDRVVNGFPGRVDRVRALGDAVVPYLVEAIGRAIMRTEEDADGSLYGA